MHDLTAIPTSSIAPRFTSKLRLQLKKKETSSSTTTTTALSSSSPASSSTSAMSFVVQSLRSFCIIGLCCVALIMGITKLTPHGAQGAHDLWVKKFENNYTPVVNEALRGIHVPLRLSHELLRLTVGTAEVACGLALVSGSRWAAQILGALLVGLCAWSYVRDDADGAMFPAVMAAMCGFIAVTGKKGVRR